MRTTLSSPCSPVFVRLSPPRKLRAFARAIPLSHPPPSPPRLLFSPLFSPTFLPVRNSWPLLLPPWNEVGMCKIVPRYALHHRVASSPLYFFLSLSFGPFYLRFTLHLSHFCSSVFLLAIVNTCRFARIFLSSFFFLSP